MTDQAFDFLIRDLRKVEKSSRELDERIDGLLGNLPDTKHGYGIYGFQRGSAGYYSKATNSEGSQFESYQSPAYTSSLDAAFKLVPENASVHMKREYGGEYAVNINGFTSHHTNRAIAVCLAALWTVDL